MKRILQYFNFTQKEQRGFLLLSLLILICSLVPYIIKYWQEDEKLNLHIQYYENVQVENKQIKSKFDNNQNDKSISTKINYFIFDPNDLPVDRWKQLGMSDKQIRVIKNYESKGGKFYKKEDLQKIYSISKDQYALLEPYIQISSKDQNTTFNNDNFKNEKAKVNMLQSVDINRADTLAFKELKGIGSVLSARIVKYRNALGGYHSVSQIAEVYGMPIETYTFIEKQLSLNDVDLKKIDINKVTKEELAKHPYISFKQANVIVNFRNQHGSFSDINSMSEIKILDQDFLRKIEPYLQFK